MLSAGATARRPLERGSNASGFVAIKALVVSCAIDDEKPTCGYLSTYPIWIPSGLPTNRQSPVC
jgi:hypothetical protein